MASCVKFHICWCWFWGSFVLFVVVFVRCCSSMLFVVVFVFQKQNGFAVHRVLNFTIAGAGFGALLFCSFLFVLVFPIVFAMHRVLNFTFAGAGFWA